MTNKNWNALCVRLQRWLPNWQRLQRKLRVSNLELHKPTVHLSGGDLQTKLHLLVLLRDFPREGQWLGTDWLVRKIYKKNKQLNLHPDNFTCVGETYLEFGWAAGFSELLVQLASPNQLVISTPVTSFSKPSQKTPPSLVLKKWR